MHVKLHVKHAKESATQKKSKRRRLRDELEHSNIHTRSSLRYMFYLCVLLSFYIPPLCRDLIDKWAKRRRQQMTTRHLEN